MSKLKVAILFGGTSEEHNISVKSAQEVANNINIEKYEPIYIGITRSGIWKMCENPCFDLEDENCHTVIISPDKKTHGLLLIRGDRCETMHIDVVFTVLHGKMGEDGSIQGLLELSGIPYVGCDVQASVLCMDKSLTYIVARSAGISTPKFWIFNDDMQSINISEYPVFVKPARSGSSFGVTKVNNYDELSYAIECARKYDIKVIIEQAILGSEVGCAVLGNGYKLTVGEVDQINLKYGLFRIHQENEPETGSENAIITVPANLPVHKREQIQETAKLIYTALGCKGLARVDMFLEKDGSILLNEVNTLPGFTSYSRYPRMMAAAGITLNEVIEQCIMSALKG